MALPVSLAEAKSQLRVDHYDEDDLIGRALVDAAGWVERYTGHILEAREVTEHFTGVGVGVGAVQLRAWPIAADAAVGVTYVDDSGASVAPTGACLDLSNRPARVLPPNGPLWPFRGSDQRFAVTIRAGYEAPADVPTNLRRAMLVMISAFYADREAGDVFKAAERSARSLCADFRMRRL